MLAIEREAAALGLELPETLRVGTDVEDVAKLPARHIQKAEGRKPKAGNKTQQKILPSSFCLLHWYFITP
ncbi:MAG TPA: hypothetical protein VJT54_07020 [Verrucomicrobiae bacterium]|nr:hypothetical protein [Verrucomicrobiae bacterium]